MRDERDRGNRSDTRFIDWMETAGAADSLAVIGCHGGVMRSRADTKPLGSLCLDDPSTRNIVDTNEYGWRQRRKRLRQAGIVPSDDRRKLKAAERAA
jgi:hypothetical protein